MNYEADDFIYIAGSLANERIVDHTVRLQNEGIGVFSEWFTPGPDADVNWRVYEQKLGYNFREALKRPAAQHIFNFDKRYIDASSCMLLVLPAGKSGHLELGYTIGKGKPAFILMDGEPERWDVMYNYVTEIFYDIEEAVAYFKEKGLGLGKRADGTSEELRSAKVVVSGVGAGKVGWSSDNIFKALERWSRYRIVEAERIADECTASGNASGFALVNTGIQLYSGMFGSPPTIQDLFRAYKTNGTFRHALWHYLRRQLNVERATIVPYADERLEDSSRTAQCTAEGFVFTDATGGCKREDP